MGVDGIKLNIKLGFFEGEYQYPVCSLRRRPGEDIYVSPPTRHSLSL